MRNDHHHANSFRTAPSLCADLIFGKDNGRTAGANCQRGRSPILPALPSRHYPSSSQFRRAARRRSTADSRSLHPSPKRGRTGWSAAMAGLLVSWPIPWAGVSSCLTSAARRGDTGSAIASYSTRSRRPMPAATLFDLADRVGRGQTWAPPPRYATAPTLSNVPTVYRVPNSDEFKCSGFTHLKKTRNSSNFCPRALSATGMDTP